MNTLFILPRLVRRHRRNGGFTLVEISIASTIALMVLAGVLTTFIQLSRSFYAISNYAKIHKDGRRAVDYFSKDMRGVVGITAYSVTNLATTIPTNFASSGVVTGSKTVRYTYSKGAYYRYDSATGFTDMLATNVYFLAYTLYDHVGNVTTLTNVAKSIQVDIKLRKYINKISETEEFLSGRYDMRNKP